MGSTFSLVIYGKDRSQLQSAARAAFDEAQRIDGLNFQLPAGQRMERGEPVHGTAGCPRFA
jgi:hypothetical protein